MSPQLYEDATECVSDLERIDEELQGIWDAIDEDQNYGDEKVTDQQMTDLSLAQSNVRAAVRLLMSLQDGETRGKCAGA